MDEYSARPKRGGVTPSARRLLRQPHGFEGFRASGRLPAARPRGPGRRGVMGYPLGDGFVFVFGCQFFAAEDRRKVAFGRVLEAAADRRVRSAGGVPCAAADRRPFTEGGVFEAAADPRLFSAGEVFDAAADRRVGSAGG